MRRSSKLVIVVSMLFANSFAGSGKDALGFFENFRNTGKSFDTSIISMYHDSAVIKTLRTEADGSTRNLELRGYQWKMLLRKTLDQAKQNNDTDEYKNITVHPSGAGYTIKAVRYSNLKCTLDSGYYMVVKETPDGMRIFEEYTRTWAVSKCANTKGVETIIDAVVGKFLSKWKLPIMPDEETRLDQIARVDKSLVYTFTLINITEEDLDDVEGFNSTLKPTVLAEVCKTDLQTIPSNGGSVEYRYNGKDNKLITSIAITKTDCSKK